MEKILNQMKKDLKIHILNNMNEENKEEMIQHLKDINEDIELDLTDDLKLDDYRYSEDSKMMDFVEVLDEFEDLYKVEDEEIINQLPIEVEFPKELLDLLTKDLKDESNNK